MARVLIVAGPTGSGKSSYAYKVAQDQKGIILNGDSIQVYKSLEILTAQPSPEKQKQVPHHLYGFLDPHETWSVEKWCSHIIPLIEKCHESANLPIVVGGTGFYLKILQEGISPIPPIDISVRKHLMESQDDLYAQLQKADPALAHQIDPHDTQRTMRGLEVFHGTGIPLSAWQKKKPTPPPYAFEKILFMPSKEDLEPRLSARLEEMVERKVVDEVAHFLSLSPSPTALKAIGLKEFGAFLKGETSLEDAKALTLLHTRQYAKRQRTWFKHQFKPDLTIEVPWARRRS